MKTIESALQEAKSLYDGGRPSVELAWKAACIAAQKIHDESVVEPHSNHRGKSYSVAKAKGLVSRPFRSDLFAADSRQIALDAQAIAKAARPTENRYAIDSETIDRAIYSATVAFACCFDLWKPRSRKTPGTYFEILIGGLIEAVLPRYSRKKHIAIPGTNESVSTDIVFYPEGKWPVIVVPAKLSTRERIVQPFAHQRILDSSSPGRFRSVLVAISELQRDQEDGVKDICVPGTVALYQRHLGALSGIYYCDPPERYLQRDVQAVLPVRTLGVLLTQDLPGVLRPNSTH